MVIHRIRELPIDLQMLTGLTAKLNDLLWSEMLHRLRRGVRMKGGRRSNSRTGRQETFAGDGLKDVYGNRNANSSAPYPCPEIATTMYCFPFNM